MDLSWPEENNVNSCIPDGVFNNMDFILKYPIIDSVFEKIQLLGSQATLYKVDLERAYLVYPLFGLK